MKHQGHKSEYTPTSYSGTANNNNFGNGQYKKNTYPNQYQGSQAEQQGPNMIGLYGNPQLPTVNPNSNQHFNRNLNEKIDEYGSGSYQQQQQREYAQFSQQQQQQHNQSFQNDQKRPEGFDLRNVLPYEFNASAGQEWRRQQFLRDQNYQKKLKLDTEFDLIDYIKNVSNNNQTNFNGLKLNSKWANKVQISEWLLESPQKVEDWFIIPCPSGKRVLLVAYEGKTEVYNKKGLLIDVLKTAIPGSRPGDIHSVDNASVLEAIYIPSKKTYFILDVLAYDGVTMMNTKTWCRLSFLTQKFTEDNLQFNYDDGTEKCVTLHLLQAYELSDQLYPENCFNTYPFWPQNQPFLGGYLFYHKYSTYIMGSNPLVCWLLPHMVPEVLEMPIHVKYMSCRPPNYVDMRTDIIKRETKKYKQQEKKNTNKMNKLQNTSSGIQSEKNENEYSNKINH